MEDSVVSVDDSVVSVEDSVNFVEDSVVSVEDSVVQLMVGFVSHSQTQHCLWILGSKERTL